MLVRGPLHPALRGVVTMLWSGRSAGEPGARERIVPTGQAHLAFRPCGTPIRLGIDGEQTETSGVIGGPRTFAHVHDRPSARSVGVMLAPGALPMLFGVSARALAGRHTGLDALWGRDADRLGEQLHDADDVSALSYVEAVLVARLRPRPPIPGLPQALQAIGCGAPVHAVAAALGRTPRTLGAWFDEAVGVSPKQWGVLARLRRALALADGEPDWSVVAHHAGYYDQAHLCRDVRALVGVSPSALRGHAPGEPLHIPVPPSDSSKQVSMPAR